MKKERFTWKETSPPFFILDDHKNFYSFLTQEFLLKKFTQVKKQILPNKEDKIKYRVFLRCLRAFPTVLTMWLQTVKFIATKTKCANLAQGISFSPPNSCSLRWPVKGATQLCSSQKECNKLDLTVARYFWFVQWFAISSPCVYSFIGGGCQKTKS
jgi:hypothetical protein